MTQTEVVVREDPTALFLVYAEIHVDAAPEQVYDVVSALERSAEWSPECTGGTWVRGEPGRVGSVFRGDNVRGDTVVSWAPVHRGSWQTESHVTQAERGSAFRWCLLDDDGRPRDAVWSFEMQPASGSGCRLVHHFRMGHYAETPTFLAGLSGPDLARFFREWNDKLASDVRATVAAIKRVVEAEAAAGRG